MRRTTKSRRSRLGPCPVGRKPFHTILTAQASLYQQWQTKIFYYHFRKVQREGGRCTEMTGFTRLLAGRAASAVWKSNSSSMPPPDKIGKGYF